MWTTLRKFLKQSVAIPFETSDNEVMAIDRFNKERFEAALPKHKDLGHNLWAYGGFQGEHFYSIHIGGDVYITVWSSLDVNGLAGDTGENSIRCYLVDHNNQPLGNKLQTYVTRVAGWENRLKDQLQQLWRMGKFIVPLCKGPVKVDGRVIQGMTCNNQQKVFISKKEGPNKGRRFRKCDKCGEFVWLDPEKVKAA